MEQVTTIEVSGRVMPTVDLMYRRQCDPHIYGNIGNGTSYVSREFPASDCMGATSKTCWKPVAVTLI